MNQKYYIYDKLSPFSSYQGLIKHFYSISGLPDAYVDTYKRYFSANEENAISDSNMNQTLSASVGCRKVTPDDTNRHTNNHHPRR